MPPAGELVMYSRTFGCPYISVARRVFADFAIGYREIMIDRDPDAKARVFAWTGFLSVPTLIIAAPGSDLPLADPLALLPGASPRGVDRGYLITEPHRMELKAWLVKHGFLTAEESAEVG